MRLSALANITVLTYVPTTNLRPPQSNMARNCVLFATTFISVPSILIGVPSHFPASNRITPIRLLCRSIIPLPRRRQQPISRNCPAAVKLRTRIAEPRRTSGRVSLRTRTPPILVVLNPSHPAVDRIQL
ncbi:hypothetical protein K474DRAFT_1382364 [Panus rudis PR-1116 ss-1]|nr:hypothetical protein K474DRAFT_1382364 [Panus rudis PR-1116 ss-1]